MTNNANPRIVSRRATLAGIGAGALTAAAGIGVSAQSTSEMSTHPLVGAWVCIFGQGTVPSLFTSDGTALMEWGPLGDNEGYTSGALGRWARVDDQSARFTVVSSRFGSDRGPLGMTVWSFTAEAGNDGQSFVCRGVNSRVTLLTPDMTVELAIGEDGSLPDFNAIRVDVIDVGAAGFWETPSSMATPTS